MSPDPNDASSWRAKVLYHHRTRTDINNERKYLGWLRVSLGMITLGFVVERLDVFLATTLGAQLPPTETILRWAPLLIYGVGGLTIASATWEFFADRRRISAEEPRGSRPLVALILLTLVSVILIAGLLWVPDG